MADEEDQLLPYMYDRMQCSPLRLCAVVPVSDYDEFVDGDLLARVQHLRRRVLVPFNPDDRVATELLERLWCAVNAEQQLPAATGVHWKQLGFQARRPVAAFAVHVACRADASSLFPG